MTMMVLLVATVCVVSLLFTWACELCVILTRRRRKEAQYLPCISVLKPLKGADEDLYENLASFAKQDYPAFELVFACEEINDPALGVVRTLQARFPNIAITVVAGGKPIGYNPKINNLHQAAHVARYDHILISDADVRVDPHYLRAMAAELADPKVGLVSSPIIGVGERSLGSAFDNLHLNTFVIGSVCAAPILAKHACVVGKSMLFRRGDLLRMGGWNKVKNVLAEDYVLGQLYERAGYRVALSSYAVHAVNRRRSVMDFAARHVRWGQMRRKLAGFLYWLEPMMMPGAWLTLLLALVALHDDSAVGPTLALVACIGVLRLASNVALIRSLRGKLPDALTLAVLPAKDVLVVAMWLYAAFSTTVIWRGNRFRIGASSVLSPLPEERVNQDIAAVEL